MHKRTPEGKNQRNFCFSEFLGKASNTFAFLSTSAPTLSPRSPRMGRRPKRARLADDGIQKADVKPSDREEETSDAERRGGNDEERQTSARELIKTEKVARSGSAPSPSGPSESGGRPRLEGRKRRNASSAIPSSGSLQPRPTSAAARSHKSRLQKEDVGKVEENNNVMSGKWFYTVHKSIRDV